MNKNIDYDYMIEILTALKDGKTIQLQDVRNKDDWFDVKVEDYVPKFNEYEYRIKPDIVRYKVGLFKDETNFTYPALIQEYAIRQHELDNKFFVRWLTDWIEYEGQL